MFKRHYYYASLGALLALFLLFLFVASDESEPASTQMQVSAVVLKKARIITQSSPTVLRITQADIERGYVEVEQPSVLSLQTNAPGDFRIHFALRGDLATHAEVIGLAQPVSIGPAGEVIAHPARERNTMLQLRWRVHLAPGAQEGLHAWPVQMQLDAG